MIDNNEQKKQLVLTLLADPGSLSLTNFIETLELLPKLRSIFHKPFRELVIYNDEESQLYYGHRLTPNGRDNIMRLYPELLQSPADGLRKLFCLPKIVEKIQEINELPIEHSSNETIKSQLIKLMSDSSYGWHYAEGFLRHIDGLGYLLGQKLIDTEPQHHWINTLPFLLKDILEARTLSDCQTLNYQSIFRQLWDYHVSQLRQPIDTSTYHKKVRSQILNVIQSMVDQNDYQKLVTQFQDIRTILSTYRTVGDLSTRNYNTIVDVLSQNQDYLMTIINTIEAVYAVDPRWSAPMDHLPFSINEMITILSKTTSVKITQKDFVTRLNTNYDKLRTYPLNLFQPKANFTLQSLFSDALKNPHSISRKALLLTFYENMQDLVPEKVRSKFETDPSLSDIFNPDIEPPLCTPTHK